MGRMLKKEVERKGIGRSSEGGRSGRRKTKKMERLMEVEKKKGRGKGRVKEEVMKGK